MAASDGPVTMADIAKAAGVSMATASRALRNAPGVSEATRVRVQEIAEEHSYVISPEASALSRGTTGRVGVIVPTLASWFFGEILEGVEPVLRTAGLDLLLYRLGARRERQAFFEQLPARRKADSVLVVGVPVTDAEQERLALLGVKVAAAGGQFATYPYVSIDDYEAGRQAVDHLIFLGHRRIAMIDAIDPNDDVWPVAGRARAYTQALAEAGIAREDSLFVRVPWGPEAAAAAAERLLGLREPPTAVFVHSDEMAFGVLSTLRRAGVRVPEDLSVISIDDHPTARWFGLTTVHQDPRNQGEMAARLVLQLRAGGSVTARNVLATQLVIRDTTAPPRR